MESSSRPVTRETAKMVLLPLMHMAAVKELQVFGSVAREGAGNDLDIIVIVDTLTYCTFVTSVWRAIESSEDEAYDLKQERFDVAMAVLKPSIAERGWFDLAVRSLGASVDLHLMPVDWQQEVERIQQHLPHRDLQFVGNIATDARRVEVWTDGPDEPIEIVGW